jgi:hypothetical protein
LLENMQQTTDQAIQALIEASRDTALWHGIFQSATGLIFFGTPFRGAEGMSQSEMLQAALSEYEQEQVHTQVLNILDPGNELLQDLVDGFGKIRSLPNRAHVACFFELQPSDVGAIVGKQRKKVSMAVHMMSWMHLALHGAFLSASVVPTRNICG